MNKQQLLNYLIQGVNAHVDIIDKWLREQSGGTETIDDRDPAKGDLKEQLFELYSRRENSCVYPPADLPNTAEEMIPILRDTYKGDVTKISLILHHYFPERYLFYRVSKLEDEVSQGFDYFSDVIEKFRFKFDRMRRTDFDAYLDVNSALIHMAQSWWPNAKNLQTRIEMFLYDHLAKLFLETSDYNRYWICSTHYEHWEDRHNTDTEDGTEVIGWSGRKDMQPGDVVFLYCSAPVKAVTDVYEVHRESWLDPYQAWDGFRVDLAHLMSIPDHITFTQMRNDPILGQWSVIKRQFQGVVTESVPHSCYNRLLTFLPQEIKVECKLDPEPVSELGSSGEFSSEQEFEDEIIEPLLKGWDLQFNRQVPCKCYFGRQRITGFVDFLVSNQGGLVTLFEDKAKIVSDNELQEAVNQAKSYALMLGLPSFVVASPEGCKLYSLERNNETLISELRPQSEKAEEEQFLSAILKAPEGSITFPNGGFYYGIRLRRYPIYRAC